MIDIAVTILVSMASGCCAGFIAPGLAVLVVVLAGRRLLATRLR